ncbi:uncharacterized protein LOC132039211 [Lycium ferocissimum]|uniref:uncharacterized protein LOC132039211 n=1 Tax=Lycium ferocissimum TaxID=112874 RepID=UPI0028154FCC|nr:uncharacterized protein LOC132039211 [Lycium ferocissimum]
MSPRLIDKFYRVMIRSVLLCVARSWPVENVHIQKMNIAEMRLLRWMWWRDMIRDTNWGEANESGAGGGRDEGKRANGSGVNGGADAPIRRCDRLDVSERLKRYGGLKKSGGR